MSEENTMFGKLLTGVQQARKIAHDEAIRDLWKRNGLSPNQRGYKIAETTAVHRDGREVVEYRLYKLIDASVTTVEAEVKSSVENGISAAMEMKPWPEQESTKSK